MTIRVVRIGVAPDALTGAVLISGAGATSLDELRDVAGAAAGAVGQVLAKTPSGQWRPATPGAGGGPPGHAHTQSAPIALWQITHGLGFRPAGIVITDTLGGLVEPDRITWPTDQIIELHFGAPVAGAAQLS